MIIIQVYAAKDGWRWRMLRKGRIIAESGEAYKRKATMTRTLNNLLTSIALGPRIGFSVVEAWEENKR